MSSGERPTRSSAYCCGLVLTDPREPKWPASNVFETTPYRSLVPPDVSGIILFARFGEECNDGADEPNTEEG